MPSPLAPGSQWSRSPVAPAPSPPRARSPAPVCGSGAAPVLPAARSSRNSSSNAGGPGISPTARPRGRLSGRLPSVRRSVAPASLCCLSGTRAGCSWSHGASAKPQLGSWSAPAAPATETPSLPPVRQPAPPPPLNSSNGSSPAEPRARGAAFPPP